MDQPKSPEELEALRAERRRERWGAFLTPLITLASIVVSVALAMYFLKTCSERHPGSPAGQRAPAPPAPR